MAETGFGAPSSHATVGLVRWRTVTLNGVNQSLSTTLGTATNAFDADFTLSGWVWIDTLGNYPVFHASNGSSEYVTLGVTSSGEVTFTQVDGTATTTLTTTSVLSAKQWHFIAVRSTSSTIELFYDTTKYGSTVIIPDIPDAVTKISIGTESYSATNYFHGQLSRIAYFPVSVSNVNLENLGKSRFTALPNTADHLWFDRDGVYSYGTTYTTIGFDKGVNGSPWQLTLNNLTEANSIDEYTKTYGATALINPVYGSDWGFGDPTPSGDVSDYAGDTGFGSPFIYVEPESTAIIDPPLGIFGDDGGYIVSVLGDWPITGPYRFKLVNSITSAEYPETTFAHSSIPGTLYRCYVAKPGVDYIKFALPVAPPGTYDIKIEWGENFGQSVLVDSKIVIIRRGRTKEVYAIRNSLPNTYKCGNRTLRSETVL